MTQLSLSLLGPFRVNRAGDAWDAFATDKVRALLAFLAMEGGRPHPRHTLAALLWPDWPDADALRNLRKSLHRLRDALDEHTPGLSDHLLTVTRQAVQLNRDVVTVDAVTFESLVAMCEAHPHPQFHHCAACIERLTQAVALYQGEFLEGLALGDAFAFEEWLIVQRERLNHQALATLYLLADAHEQRGEDELAYRYAARQLAIEPWREEAHRQAMRALALGGQRSEALAQYQRCRRVLAEELGIEPATETTQLYEQIQAGEQGALPAERWLRPRTRERLHHFPAQFTAFVGREAELRVLVEHLTDPVCRLVTITGAGGMGKSRLSLHLADRLATTTSLFPDGIYLISLAATESASLLPSAIASRVGLAFHERATPGEQLVEHLRSRNLLLVLDNFEQLLDGVELLLEILAAAPEVKLLVTSREPLNLRAEWRLALEGLPYPTLDKHPSPSGDASDGAVALFVQAAARARLGFTLTPEELPLVIRICHLLRGMPLALEIAASWVRSYDVETIARQVAESLDFLVSPLRDVPPRHQSVRALFEHSWQLLPSDEQLALAQMSLCQGSFALEAALAITGATLGIVTSLLDKALLQRAEPGRYESHELIRHFAAEKLAHWQDATLEVRARERHARFYLARVAEGASALHGAGARDAAATIRRDLPNVRLAWHWALRQHRLDLLAPSIEGLGSFYLFAGLFEEGVGIFSEAVDALRLHIRGGSAAASLVAVALCDVLLQQTRLLRKQARYDAAGKTVQEALTLAQAHHFEERAATAQLAWSRLLELQDDYARALAYQKEALRFYEAGEQSEGVAQTLSRIGNTYWRLGEYQQALAYLQRALRLAEVLGYTEMTARHLSDLGIIYRDQGEYQQARDAFRKALKIEEELGHEEGIARVSNNLGLVHWPLGEYDEALACYERALSIAQRLGLKRGIALCVGNMGIIYRLKGEYERALACYQQALEIDESSGHRTGVTNHLGNMGNVYKDMGRDDKALDHYERALRVAQEIGYREAIGRHLTNLGELAARRGHHAAAVDHYDEAVALLRELGARYYLADTLNRKAELLLARGEVEAASALNQEAIRLATETGTKEYGFNAQLLAARIQGAQGESDLAREHLCRLLETASQEAEQAALYYELWRLSGEVPDAREALSRYGRLYARTPNAQYGRHLDELRTAITAPAGAGGVPEPMEA